MPKGKRITKKEIGDGLRRLAFGDITDAVKLLYESEGNIICELGSLDLFNVSEIKKLKGVGTEIKFFDRPKRLTGLPNLQTSRTKNAKALFLMHLKRVRRM
ncbi:MAG: hypothetical protein LUG95_07530 [Clostridiales bacterium]|nr:hypothetical protein [Clostridiales bacterium]